MTIDRLVLRNFLMFTGRKNDIFEKIINNDFYDLSKEELSQASAESFEERFIDGINVFIGSNATGKSTLLKCIYGACEFSKKQTLPGKAKTFSDYFSASHSPIKDINQKDYDVIVSLVQAFSGDIEFHYRAWDSIMMSLGKWQELNINSVLIPTAEMLSHSTGLLAMASKYGIPFD